MANVLTAEQIKKNLWNSFMVAKRAIIFIISAREARLHIGFNCVSPKRVIRFGLLFEKNVSNKQQPNGSGIIIYGEAYKNRRWL